MAIKRTRLKVDEWKPDEKCAYSAPYICFQNQEAKTWHVQQSCCNHWDCPRCGIIRAKEEYARIVTGAEKLTEDGYKLYFWTVTCRGKELSRDEAETGYLEWTDRLLASVRMKTKRAIAFWCYVQVTERQRRGHPHSHLLTTYIPDDAIPYAKGELLPNGRYAQHDCLWSEWFRQANVSAGLGVECDLSAVKSAAAVARYVGKYLFKQTALDTWPPRWKRVRYSQNWPELPDKHNPTAFPVIKFRDWFRIHELHVPVRADSVYTYSAAQARGINNVLPPKWDTKS